MDNNGECPVYIEFEIPSKEVVKIKTSEKYFVSLTDKVRTQLRDLIEAGCVASSYLFFLNSRLNDT